MSNISQAIVLSAGPNGLGALRSLTLENVITDVIVLNEQESVLYSRLYSQAEIIAQDDKEQGVLALLRKRQVKGQVLIPTSDWFVDFLVRHQEELSNDYLFVLPGDNLSKRFIDKREEIALVGELVHLPKSVTHLPENSDELTCAINLPMIIKPRSNELNRLGKKNIVVNTQLELQAFYQQYPEALEYCVAQELIEGDDDRLWVCNCVFDERHQLINAFTFQRLQLTPPHFGVTCYAQSIENKDIIKQVQELGAGLNYVGPAMVEFKFDDKDQLYKYIEVNPRLGLCNYFDTSCGRNNVYATYCLAKNLPFTSSPDPKHRIFISVFEDLYSRYRDGQSVISIARTYLSDLFKPHTFIYFCWRDPWPSIAVGYNQIRTIIKSIWHKLKK